MTPEQQRIQELEKQVRDLETEKRIEQKPGCRHRRLGQYSRVLPTHSRRPPDHSLKPLCGYAGSFSKLTDARQIAVIGAGQSATEIFLDLHGHPNTPEVDMIMRGRAMHPSDDSPSGCS